ncbi:MAG: ATP-binding protein [Desulfovermiculus sp.]|nr:ATP-binding protein [Desulfovermiculus sp.]
MEKIDEKLRMLQPVLGRQKTGRLRQLYFFADDFREQKEIENRIDLLISRHVKTEADDQVLLPPPGFSSTSDISLGSLEYRGQSMGDFGLTFQDINRHLGIFGATGSGKTTLAINLIRKLHQKKIPFLIFDWEKSYRNLVAEFSDVEVFTLGSDVHPLRLNILDLPPGISREEYIKSVIVLIAEDYLSGAGSDTMFLHYMGMTYDEVEEPSLEDLKEVVLREIQKDMKGRGKLSGRKGLWQETVQRIIRFWSTGALNSLFSGKPVSMDKLLNKNIVLELGGIQSPRDRKFVIHCILNWLFHWLQYQGIEAEKLSQCLIFEEFHNITLKSREDNLISLLFRQCRKYGLGLVGIDQTPSEIANAIFANMNTKISFALATSQDITAIAKAVNIHPFKAKYFGMLETGQAIANVKQRSADCFLVRVPHTQVPAQMQDRELQIQMEPFTEAAAPDWALSKLHSPKQAPPEKESFPPLERVLLTNIIERPLDGVDLRTKKLGVHSSVMSKLHTSLSDKGLIQTRILDQKKLFELTDYGKTMARELGIQVPVKKSKGGLEHEYWIDRVVQFLRKHEFQPVQEVQDIDIVDTTNSLAIEIETGKSDIKANLVKLEKSQVSARFMLATTMQAKQKITKIGQSHPLIRIMLTKEFLKLEPEQIVSHSHP